jgi:hypothetical protein
MQVYYATLEGTRQYMTGYVYYWSKTLNKRRHLGGLNLSGFELVSRNDPWHDVMW